MPNPKAKFQITADDKTAAALRSAQDRISRFSRRTNSLLRGAFAGIGFGLLTRQIITNTRAQEDAMVQLRAAIESTGGVAGFTAEQLAQMAKDLQQLTRFGDEAILSMQSVLLTFTRIRGPELERTQQAILDVATRMGTTLQGAAVQLGKALNDPVANLGELGRAGIQFSKDQKAVIKSMVETGRLAEAQSIILDELETQFGGAAVAARQTFGGAIEGLKNAFGDLLEGSGGNLNEATESLNDLTDLLQDPATVEGFETITAAIIAMTNIVVKGTTAIADFTTEFGEGVARLSGAGTPIDEAADRIEMLRNSIETLRKASLHPGSSSDFLIQEFEKEITALEKMVALNEELERGKRIAAESSTTANAQASEMTAEVLNTVEARGKETAALLEIEDSLDRQKKKQEEINALIKEAQIQRQEREPGFVGPPRDDDVGAILQRTISSGDPDLGPQPTPEQRGAADEFQKKLAEATQEASEEMSIFARRAFENIQDAGAEFFASAIRGFGDLKSVGQSALNALLDTFAQQASKSFLTAIFGSIPGFQQGGQFTVGGSGGPDSQLAAFRATPGETVTITKPGQSLTSGSTVIRQEFNFPIAFPTELQAFIQNIAGPAGRDAATQVLRAQQGKF